MQRLRILASRAIFPAGIAAAALLPLALHWLSGRTLVWLDTQALYAPLRVLVDEALRSLRLPLWNPHSGTGMPLFAEGMHGVLHPISVAVAWLGTGRSADLLIGGYVAAAALGAAWLARELGLSRAAAALAALTYALSGFVLSMAGNLVFLAGAASLPFCAAGLRRAGSSGGAAAVAAGVLGSAVLALSGDAQALMVGGPLGVALALEAGGARGLARAACAGLLGLLLASVQLVPAAAHLPRTERANRVARRVELQWALQPARLPEAVVPGYFHHRAEPAIEPVFAAVAGAGGWPSGSDPFPFSASIFVGLVPLSLAGVGLLRDRRGKLLAAVALALVWVALGPRLGAADVLRHVPIWSSFRYMEKLVGPITLIVALLAGLGADAASEDRRSARRVLVAAGLLGAGALALAKGVAAGLEPVTGALLAERIAAGAWHVGLGAASLGGWLLLHPRLGSHRGTALVALAWAGSLAATPAALRPGDPDARLRGASPRLVAEPPGPRILVPYFNPLAAPPAGMDSFDGDGLHFSELGLPAYNVRDRIDNLGEYSGMVPLRLLRLRLLFGERWSWAARRFALTHVLLDRPQTEEQAARASRAVEGAIPLSATDGVQTWATPHRPWASFATGLRRVANESEGIYAMMAVVDEGASTAVIETGDALAAAPGTVLSLERGAERVRVEAVSDADATLVIADAWWPGWEARIEGREVPIHLADGLVRAVPWPAGRHVLEMEYRPPEVRSGLLLSALGLAILGAWMAVAGGGLERLRRRRPSCSRG